MKDESKGGARPRKTPEKFCEDLRPRRLTCQRSRQGLGPKHPGAHASGVPCACTDIRRQGAPIFDRVVGKSSVKKERR
jgi:hypothetical protein